MAARLPIAAEINTNTMDRNLLQRGVWHEVSPIEAESIRGGFGLGDIKRVLKLIGSFFQFAHEYYDDFMRGYENGRNLF